MKEQVNAGQKTLKNITKALKMPDTSESLGPKRQVSNKIPASTPSPLKPYRNAHRHKPHLVPDCSIQYSIITYNLNPSAIYAIRSNEIFPRQVGFALWSSYILIHLDP